MPSRFLLSVKANFNTTLAKRVLRSMIIFDLIEVYCQSSSGPEAIDPEQVTAQKKGLRFILGHK